MKTKRVKPNFLFKLSDLTSKFSLTLGYLNPDLTQPCFLNIVYGTDKENMFDHQELHKMMVISFILMTFTFESRVIVFRRN